MTSAREVLAAARKKIERPECFICGRSDDEICTSLGDVLQAGDARCRAAAGLLRLQAIALAGDAP